MFEQIKIKSNQFRPTLKSACSLAILLTAAIIINACSETNNPMSNLGESTVNSPKSSATDNNNVSNDPINIAGYEVTFIGTEQINGDTKFNYKVSGTGVAPAMNNFTLETLACEGGVVDYTPTQSVQVGANSITWQAAIPPNGERDYSITYEGGLEPIADAVNATIRRGTLIETKSIPGPDCQSTETFTVSGFVYGDSNENGVKNNNELGISNVKVDLWSDSELSDSQLTFDGGYYIFTVPANSNVIVKVPEASSSSGYNEQLFELFNATSSTSIDLTVNEDKMDQNFGFALNGDVIISKFSSGDISLDTENFRYWRKQLLLAINSERTPGRDNQGDEIPAMNESTADLLEYLKEIEENFLLPNIFNFGSDKLQSAYNILQTPALTDEQNLCVQLLTAELNIVSGRGSGSPELDLAIAAFGEFFAAEGNLCTPAAQNSMMLKSVTVIEIVPSTFTSSSTIKDSGTLLTSFNGGGGGGIGTK